MVISAPDAATEFQQPRIGEQRVVIRGVSWPAYPTILEALPQALRKHHSTPASASPNFGDLMARHGEYFSFCQEVISRLKQVQPFPKFLKSGCISFWSRLRRMKLNEAVRLLRVWFDQLNLG